MNKDTKALVPELRFPGFKEQWEERKLRAVLLKNSVRNKELKYSLVQSVSNKYGFIDQDEYFENRIVASKNTSNYYIVKKGYFAYNPSRIDVGSLAYKNDDNTAIISPLYVSFRAKNDLVIDLFLLHWFTSEAFKNQMIFEGGVRNTLSYENLSEINIQLPKLTEQQKIADCLSSLDTVIDGHNKRLEMLREHKKGLMQQLFPQEREKVPRLRFPEFKGKWEKKRLGNLATLIKDRVGKRDVTLFSIDAERGLISQIEKFGRIIAGKSVSNYILIQRGDFAYNKSSTKAYPQGQIALLETHEEGAVPNSIFTCFRFNQELIKSEYAKYLFINNIHGKWLRDFIEIGARAHGSLAINNSDLLNLPVAYSRNISEQKKIADCLSSLDNLIEAERRRIEQLQLHKKGLMQKLFPVIND